MSSSITVAVSGKSGCGNSTVSRIVAGELGLKLINYTFKDLASDMGVSFDRMCLLAEQDSRHDLHLDRTQLKLAVAGNCVLGSRLAIWLLGNADAKVYLYAPLEIRAARISERESTEYERTLDETKNRDRRDRTRYERLYGIDIDRYDHADIVIDATQGDPDALAETIVGFVREKTSVF